MMTFNKRASVATRAIFSNQGGEPVHYLEAVALEKMEKKREGLVLDVARRIATHANPVEAAKAIIEAFLTPPRPDTTPDDPHIAMRAALADRAVLLRRQLRERFPQHFLDRDVHAPGQEDPATRGNKASEPPADDDRRGVDEVLRAAKALGLAVRMNADLVDVVTGAADKLDEIASRMRTDTSGRIALRNAARDVREAVKAAGTLDPRTDAEKTDDDRDHEVAMRAMREAGVPPGEEVLMIDVAINAAKSWHGAHRTGHTRFTQERWTALSVQRAMETKR